MGKSKTHMFFLNLALVLAVILAPMLSQSVDAKDTGMDHASMDHMSMDHMSMDHASMSGAMEMADIDDSDMSCEEHCAKQLEAEKACIADCLQLNLTHFAYILDEFLSQGFTAQIHGNRQDIMAQNAIISFIPPPPKA